MYIYCYSLKYILEMLLLKVTRIIPEYHNNANYKCGTSESKAWICLKGRTMFVYDNWFQHISLNKYHINKN
jgi:hypothetical protein